MRAKRTSPISIFDQFAAHDIDRELAGMSARLDAHPVLLDFVAEDLGSSASTGRCGLTAESTLRCALLKQYRQLTYEELAFHLLDSASFQAFARLPLDWTPKKAALQVNIAAITYSTWQALNAQLLGAAGKAGMERATMWRIDSTVIDSPIHASSDSGLLLDGVRVMDRLLAAGNALPGAPVLEWHNHMRWAKKRTRAIRYTRGKDKKQPHYRNLIKLTLGYLAHSGAWLRRSGAAVFALLGWQADVERSVPLIKRLREIAA